MSDNIRHLNPRELSQLEDADYALSEDAMDRLWRARNAIRLLADLNNDVATSAGINADGPAAVAEYASEDMLAILTTATRLRGAPSTATGEDTI